MGDIKEEVFERVFKKSYIYNFYDSDTKNLVMTLRVWLNREEMKKIVNNYWQNAIAHGYDFEEYLTEKGIIYEDVEIEGEFDV